ncbi:hypothetical protein [Paenibacillus xylanexedens]|uniref:hypothetical protein n=1 Tax=Paenibacillus xylanexedens TaxID=528191 RepID=UPI0011A74A8C|nr:hypothetical protein [Paenibacillus xylanexedens]
MNKQAVLFWTFITLAAIGALAFLSSGGISRIVIPLIVLGGIFLLYKYPPQRWRRKSTPKVKPSARTMAKVNAQQSSTKKSTSGSSKKRKDYPFQVIQGQKGKSDEDIPKFH